MGTGVLGRSCLHLPHIPAPGADRAIRAEHGARAVRVLTGMAATPTEDRCIRALAAAESHIRAAY